MARVKFQLPDFEISFDVTQDPLHILLTAEDDDAEADAYEAELIAGTAVTTVKSSNYTKE